MLPSTPVFLDKSSINQVPFSVLHANLCVHLQVHGLTCLAWLHFLCNTELALNLSKNSRLHSKSMLACHQAGLPVPTVALSGRINLNILMYVLLFCVPLTCSTYLYLGTVCYQSSAARHLMLQFYTPYLYCSKLYPLA